jgi:hypothetical protein
MPLRICPNCNTSLGDFDCFFCSTCGFELPENLGKLPGTIKIREYSSLQPLWSFSRKKASKSQNSPKKEPVEETNSLSQKTAKSSKMSFNKKMAIILFFVVLCLIAFFIGFYFYLKSRPISKHVTTNQFKANYHKTINLGLQSKIVDFEKISATDYAPADSIFYAEISDFSYFYEKWMSSDLLGLDVATYIKLKSLVNNNGFSLFAFRYNGNVYWTAVFTPTNVETMTKELQGFKSNKFKARLIDNKLVVFQNNASENVIKTVESVKKGQSLKISLNPEYVKAIGSLQPNGQMRVVLLKNQESPIILTEFADKYFKSNKAFFTKLLEVTASSFVVSN